MEMLGEFTFRFDGGDIDVVSSASGQMMSPGGKMTEHPQMRLD